MRERNSQLPYCNLHTDYKIMREYVVLSADERCVVIERFEILRCNLHTSYNKIRKNAVSVSAVCAVVGFMGGVLN